MKRWLQWGCLGTVVFLALTTLFGLVIGLGEGRSAGRLRPQQLPPTDPCAQPPDANLSPSRRRRPLPSPATKPWS